MIRANSVPANIHVNPRVSYCAFIHKSPTKLQIPNQRLLPSFSLCASFCRTGNGQFVPKVGPFEKSEEKSKSKKRVFLLDVNPICYEGNRPSLHSFGRWISLFLSRVSLKDPIIAVLDGERGSEHRQSLLPSYKAHRTKPASGRFTEGHTSKLQEIVIDVLKKCNVPVVKVKGYEADDVVATLAGQVVQKGYQAIIASPDKDFKQLISDDVQLVMPLEDLGRWSFYTLNHYLAQYNCDPQSDLSFRCIMGDEVDGVPGIQNVVPGFGRRTAMKLVKKHGSLEKLLDAAAVRTVGKPYAQEALTKYADYLRKNYQVLALRRDIDVCIQDQWLVERDTSKDSVVLSNFVASLEDIQKTAHPRTPPLFKRLSPKDST